MSKPGEIDDRENGQHAALTFMDERVRRGLAKRLDTHISAVFLEPDRVLKIKRAVRLPFLDYSSLDKRKQACEDELVVNRRYAPQIYRRVVPITRGRQGLEIDGAGPAIEWAVEMARFDESRTLDHLAARGELKPADRRGTRRRASQLARTGGDLRRRCMAGLHRHPDRSQHREVSHPAFTRKRCGRAAARPAAMLPTPRAMSPLSRNTMRLDKSAGR